MSLKGSSRALTVVLDLFFNNTGVTFRYCKRVSFINELTIHSVVRKRGIRYV